MQELHNEELSRLEEESAGSSGSCFPGDAQVITPQGRKFMRDLRVGDRVLVPNNAGHLVYDDVYFFGHADASCLKAYVQLNLLENNDNLSRSFKPQLELSEDHFLHVCPHLSTPCEW